MTKTLVFVLAVFPPLLAQASGWHCRNDVEITCSRKEGCDAKTGDRFTPMDMEFNEAGRLEVCAYSGCWKGSGQVFKANSVVTLVVGRAAWSTPGSRDDQTIVVVVDQADGIGLLKVAGFAHPVLCERGK